MGESSTRASRFVLRPKEISGRRFTRLAAVFISVLLSLIGGSASAIGTPWPMFQYNAAHTGYVPVTLNTAAFTVRWQKALYAYSLNPVTAADGKVYVTDYGYFSNPGLSVLDAATGTVLWSDAYGSIFSVNPPSYAYGNVYIQTCDNYADTYIRAYDANTGALVYRTMHGAQWERYYAPTIYDGKVYVDGGSYGGMYCFDAFSGVQNWFAWLNQYDQWTPAVDDKYAYAYTGEYSPNLSVIDRLTGALAFSIPDTNFSWNGWSMDLAPVLGAAHEVLAIHDGRLICFDLSARNIRWQLPAHFSGQPSLANGVIYAISSGALNALDEVTGNLLWAWEVPTTSLIDTMIVTDSHVLVRTTTAVYAVNLQTHRADWTYGASGHLALGEGVLYLAGDDGVLTAISAPSIGNHQPVSAAGGPYIADCNNGTALIQLDGTGSSDPDGNTLTYNWSSDCPGATFDDATSPKPKLTMNCSAGQSCTVTLTVNDGQSTNSSQAIVTFTNHPPVSVAGGPYLAECRGSSTLIQLNGTRSNDPDGGSITYRWSTDCPRAFFDDATSPTPKLTIMDCSPGASCSVTLAVNDGQYTTTSDAVVTISNHPPTCVIGYNYVFECNGSNTIVQLDGSRSSDPDGTPLTFHWTSSCPGASFDDPTSPTPKLKLTGFTSLSCGVTLSVSDGYYTKSGTTEVVLMDREAPHISLAADRTTLWPANHQMIPVTIRAQVKDTCDPAPVWYITAVTSSDAPGKHVTQPQYKITGQNTVLLRAERANAFTTRVYNVTVQAWDASGNSATRTIQISVPALNDMKLLSGLKH